MAKKEKDLVKSRGIGLKISEWQEIDQIADELGWKSGEVLLYAVRYFLKEFENSILLTRARYTASASQSLRFYREYFKPASERAIEKDHQRITRTLERLSCVCLDIRLLESYIFLLPITALLQSCISTIL